MATWGSLANCCGLYRVLGRSRSVSTLLSASRRSIGVRDTRVACVHQFPSPEIKNEKAARTFIVTLDDKSRDLLLQEMQQFENERMQLQNANGQSTITNAELWNVFLFHGIPFVGFGLLDNLIMIVAGEYIDSYFGVLLGISTMAAAGLGNLVSDVAGVWSAGYVEAWTARIGFIKVPMLSPAQASDKRTRRTIGLGRCLGISLGCLIGMFPLLFFKGKPHDQEELVSSPTEGTTSTQPASPAPST